jgi:hypothetical protein
VPRQDLSVELKGVQSKIDRVEGEIASVTAQLADAKTPADVEYFRKKEEALRKKEEALRKKEEQLREQLLRLLPQQPPAGGSGLDPKPAGQ